MKKLIKYIFLALIVILTPIKVFACPHVDDEGNLHFQFYNEDYSIMTRMYPKERHIYNKNEFMENGELESEDFGFPLVLDRNGYLDQYYFIDERINYDNFNEIELETTIENLDNVLVNGTGYNLLVNFENTKIESANYIDEKTYQMYYSIKVNKLNEEIDNENYISLTSSLNENEIELVVPLILEIKANLSITDSEEYNYEFEKIEINKLYDDITVQVISNNLKEDVVAINIEELENISPLECNYNTRENLYEFDIDSRGTYIIVEKSDIEKIKDIKFNSGKEDINKGEDNVDKTQDSNSGVSPFIIIGITLLSLTIVTVIVLIIINNKE